MTNKQEREDEDSYESPVLSCPECERPNQFGQTCCGGN